MNSGLSGSNPAPPASLVLLVGISIHIAANLETLPQPFFLRKLYRPFNVPTFTHYSLLCGMVSLHGVNLHDPANKPDASEGQC